MAASDYYLCDICGAKTFYDAEVNYEPRVGDMKCICTSCAETYSCCIVAKIADDPARQETT